MIKHAWRIGSLALMSGAVLAASTSAVMAAPVALRAPAVSAPYTIYLYNNFVGNDWLIQMQKEAKVAATLAPFKGKVNLTVTVAPGTVPGQIQSLEAIVARKPAAILLDASSPTALNPVISQACKDGIVVVNFDQVVT